MAARLDPNSETWRAVRDWAQHKGGISRDMLTARSCPERDADFERGRLSLIKELLELPGSSTITGEPNG